MIFKCSKFVEVKFNYLKLNIIFYIFHLCMCTFCFLFFWSKTLPSSLWAQAWLQLGLIWIIGPPNLNVWSNLVSESRDNCLHLQCACNALEIYHRSTWKHWAKPIIIFSSVEDGAILCQPSFSSAIYCYSGKRSRAVTFFSGTLTFILSFPRLNHISITKLLI